MDANLCGALLAVDFFSLLNTTLFICLYHVRLAVTIVGWEFSWQLAR